MVVFLYFDVIFLILSFETIAGSICERKIGNERNERDFENANCAKQKLRNEQLRKKTQGSLVESCSEQHVQTFDMG